MFTEDEVYAVAYASRMLIKHMPEDGSIEHLLVDNMLGDLNSALTKMEESCEETSQ